MNITRRVELTESSFIDEVVREANKSQNRERMFLSFNEYRMVGGGETYVIVFFSILEEKAPILFQDCIGRKMTLPFEMFRTWEVSNALCKISTSPNAL